MQYAGRLSDRVEEGAHAHAHEHGSIESPSFSMSYLKAVQVRRNTQVYFAVFREAFAFNYVTHPL